MLFNFPIILSMIIGIVIYQFKDLKKVILGGYNWIVKKDYRFYKQITHVYFIFMIIFVHLLLFLFEIIPIKPSIFISFLLLSIIKIVDGDSDIEDFTIYDFLLFFVCLFVGGILKQTPIFTLLFARIKKLNAEESYNIFSYNILTVLIFQLIKTPFLLDFSCLWSFIITVLLSYMSICLFHYLHSLNRLKFIGRIGLILYVIFMNF